MFTDFEAIAKDLVHYPKDLNQAYETEKDRREQVLSVIKRINSPVTIMESGNAKNDSKINSLSTQLMIKLENAA